MKPGTLGSTDRAALDNQWATYFLIDPTSGFAPMAWQCAVGPVVLFRPGGAAISIKQVCCMESFLDLLLDTFSDVAPGALLEWMTPLHCGRFAAPLLSMRVTMMMAHVLGLRLTLDFLLGLRA